MLVLLSPAKKLRYDLNYPLVETSQPVFLNKAHYLVDRLRGYSPQQLAELMQMSDDLAQLNLERYQAWHIPFTLTNAKPALFVFAGEVYEHLQAHQLSASALDHARKHLRILSGLYGLLSPFDLMQAYRLEMGTRFQQESIKDLYSFWGDSITEHLNQELANREQKQVINLASQEYFKVIKPKKLQASVITPVFKEAQQGKYRIISFFAKRARGLMTRYILEQQITHEADLLNFQANGYRYRPDLSQKPHEPVFARDKIE